MGVLWQGFACSPSALPPADSSGQPSCSRTTGTEALSLPAFVPVPLSATQATLCLGLYFLSILTTRSRAQGYSGPHSQDRDRTCESLHLLNVDRVLGLCSHFPWATGSKYSEGPGYVDACWAGLPSSSSLRRDVQTHCLTGALRAVFQACPFTAVSWKSFPVHMLEACLPSASSGLISAPCLGLHPPPFQTGSFIYRVECSAS